MKDWTLKFWINGIKHEFALGVHANMAEACKQSVFAAQTHGKIDQLVAAEKMVIEPYKAKIKRP